MTKKNWLVNDVSEIPQVIAEAFHVATSGRPGPVLVDIPNDVLAAPAGPFELPSAQHARHARAVPNVAVIEEIGAHGADLILRSLERLEGVTSAEIRTRDAPPARSAG